MLCHRIGGRLEMKRIFDILIDRCAKAHRGEFIMKKKTAAGKMVALLTAAIVLTTVITGCSASKKPSGDKNPTDTNVETPNGNEGSNNGNEDVDLAGTINITGSTSVEKILHDMMDEFTAYNPDVNINYTGTGSSSGISDTLTLVNDIGVSSRALKDDEKIDGLKEVIFAHDGIAVVVNPANPITNLSLEDLGRIYSGEITNWSAVGGEDASIIVVSREDASGTKTAFEELIKLGEYGSLTQNATVVEGNGNIQSSVAGNKNAIGYVSFSFIDESVKGISINEVAPTVEDVKAGNYPLSRPFLMVYMESKLSDTTKAFLDFATSAEGQEFVTEHGGIRID